MNNLIERYVHDVAQRLPENQRQDVSRELTGTIEDMVAAEVAKGQTRDAAINSVLTELGNPLYLAQEYSTSPQYLIGPKLFGVYKELLMTVLKYVTPIVSVALVIMNIIKGDTIFGVVGGAIGGIINIVIMIIFWFTLTFVIIERTNTEVPELNEEWKPSSLPPLPAKRQVSIFDASAEIIGTLFGLAFLAYLANAPLFNLAVWQPIWVAIVTIMFLQLLLEIGMLKVGNWILGFAVVEVLLDFAVIAVVAAIATSQNIINPAVINNLQDHGFNNADTVVPMVMNIILIAIVAVASWQIIESVWMHIKFRQTAGLKTVA